MKKAIKLAIEKGGYDSNPTGYNKLKADSPRYTDRQRNSCVLDPEFWRSLGKALGWKDTFFKWEIWNKEEGLPGYTNIHNWERHALDYMHLVFTDGDTEKFWKELIK